MSYRSSCFKPYIVVVNDLDSTLSRYYATGNRIKYSPLDDPQLLLFGDYCLHEEFATQALYIVGNLTLALNAEEERFQAFLAEGRHLEESSMEESSSNPIPSFVQFFVPLTCALICLDLAVCNGRLCYTIIICAKIMKVLIHIALLYMKNAIMDMMDYIVYGMEDANEPLLIAYETGEGKERPLLTVFAREE